MKYILTKDKRPFKVIEIDITRDTLIKIHINGLVYLADKIDGKRIVIHRFNDLMKLLSFRQVSENNNFVNAIIKYQILQK